MAAELFTVPFQCVVVSGLAVPGATLTFYQTGTTTKLPVYTTSALTTQQTNPVVANAAGHIPDTYLDTANTYRLVINNRIGTELDDIDPYIPGVTTLGITLTSATGQSVNSRGALAALSPVINNQVAFLTEAGREGMFVFSTANLASAVTADPGQAIYVAPAAASTGASGAWVRRYSGAVNATWYGTVADGTTNNATALQRWLDHGGHLYLPAGEYYSASKLIIRKNVVLEGEGYGFDARIVDGSATTGYENQPGSRIHFAAGVGGLDIQPQTTVTDVATAVAAGTGGYTQEGASGSYISNLGLIGAGSGAAATAVYCRSLVHLNKVDVLKFTGKGFDFSASSDVPDGNSEYGSVDCSSLTNCRAIQNGSHGFHIRGREANDLTLTNCWSQLNGGWGFLDESIAGNACVGGLAATNTAGSYKCITAVANSTYTGCYVEGGTGQAPDLSYRCVVNGGRLADMAYQYNIGTNHNPTISSPRGVDTPALNFNIPQATGTIAAGNARIYRGADRGLTLQGTPDVIGTYSHALVNGADEVVLKMHNTTKGMYIEGPITLAGHQVVGPQLATVAAAAYAVSDPPTLASYDALVDVVNGLRARLITHGLIAP